MRVRLKAIIADLVKDDEDLVLLALSTLRRGELATQRYELDQLRKVDEILGALQGRSNQDVVMFARMLREEIAQNPVITEAGGGGGEAGDAGAAPAPGALPDLGALRALGPEERAAAVSALKGSGLEGRRPLVLQLLEAAELDGLTAAAALGVLAEVGQNQDLALLRRFQGAADGRVRANAIEAVAALGTPPEIFAMLVSHLKDPDARARANALKAVGALDTKMVKGALTSMVRSGSIAAKASALYVLATLDAPFAVELLEELAGDESEEVRRRVADALEEKSGPRVEALLIRLINDIDIDVAERALELHDRLTGGDPPGAAASLPVPPVPGPPDVAPAPNPAPAPPPSLDLPAPPEPAAPATAVLEGLPEPAGAAPAEVTESQALGMSVQPEGEGGGLDLDALPPALGMSAMTYDEQGVREALADAGAFDARPEAAPEPEAGPEPKPPDPRTLPTEELAPPDTPVSLETRPGDPDSLSVSASDVRAALPSEVFDEGGAPGLTLDELPPDVLLILDELYEEIDDELRAMGKKAHLLQENSRINHDSLRQAGYRVKRFEDLLEKRKTAELQASGVFDKIFGLSGKKEDPAQLRLEASIDEEFRKVGELLIDLQHKEGLRLGELDNHYRKIDGVLERVRDVRQSVE